ncbi:hypothetical protein Mapa_006926 [Marchantia paleacea]|nr:hypothetical protein Mapa_006926 [Marchantia paleacea]
MRRSYAQSVGQDGGQGCRLCARPELLFPNKMGLNTSRALYDPSHSPRVATTPTVRQQLATARNRTTFTTMSSALPSSLPLLLSAHFLHLLSLPPRHSLPTSSSPLFSFSRPGPSLSLRYDVGADESLWGRPRPLFTQSTCLEPRRICCPLPAKPIRKRVSRLRSSLSRDHHHLGPSFFTPFTFPLPSPTLYSAPPLRPSHTISISLCLLFFRPGLSPSVPRERSLHACAHSGPVT